MADRDYERKKRDSEVFTVEANGRQSLPMMIKRSSDLSFMEKNGRESPPSNPPSYTNFAYEQDVGDDHTGASPNEVMSENF